MWKRGKEEDFPEEKFSSYTLKHNSVFVIISLLFHSSAGTQQILLNWIPAFYYSALKMKHKQINTALFQDVHEVRLLLPVNNYYLGT